MKRKVYTISDQELQELRLDHPFIVSMLLREKGAPIDDLTYDFCCAWYDPSEAKTYYEFKSRSVE